MAAGRASRTWPQIVLGVAGAVAFGVAVSRHVARMPLIETSSSSPTSTPAAPAPDGASIAIQTCGGCHGAEGNTQDASFPRLAGQLSTFIALQLRNYRDGERPSPEMASVAKQLTDAEIDAVARYFSALPPMQQSDPPDAKLAARGEAVFREGRPGAPACRYCHGEKGEGVAPVFARLAGQNPDFIIASIEPYRRDERFRNPYAYVMKAVVENLSDDDIKAVAAYVAGLTRTESGR
jgi:cytochrome c553